MKQRKALAILCSAATAVGGMFLLTGANSPTKAAPFTGANQYNGYSTGTNVFADLLKNLQPGVELANANVAFSGAASNTSGLKPLNNEMDHAVIPSDLETAGKVPTAPFNSYGRGSGLEVGLGTTIPNNPDVNQIILAGMAEEAAAPVTGTTGASQPDGSVVKELPPGGIPGDPLIYASLLRGQAKALYTPNQCVVDPNNVGQGRGEVGRLELINTAMGPLAPKLGDPNSQPLLSLTRGQPTQGTLGSSDSRVHLTPNAGSTTHFGVMSETSQDIAPVTLFKGTTNQLTIEVAGEWSLRALATGNAATSSLKYGPTFNGAPPTPTTPLITITPPGGAPQIVLKTQDIFGPGKVPQNIFIPGGPGPQLLELNIGEDPRAIGSDNVTTTPLPAPTVSNTEVSGAVDVIRVKVLAALQTPGDHVGEVRIGHMEAKSVVPNGGVDCSGTIATTTTTTQPGGSTTTTTQPGATTTTTQPGATTTTTEPGGTTTTTAPVTPGNTTTTTQPGATTSTTEPGATTSTTAPKRAAVTTTTTAPAQVQAVTFSQTPTAQAQSQTPNFTG
jgi:hypothetical protein